MVVPRVRNMGWKRSVVTVLTDAEESMSPQDILDQISLRGLRAITGERPTNTVGGQLHVLLAEGVVQRMERGKYSLVPPDGEVADQEDDFEEIPIIKNFGIGWRRDMVKWERDGNILGGEADGAVPINIAPFQGIYILMDNREMLYVGRTTARTLGVRLYEHTRNRMGGRWDRFSWFAIEGENADATKMIEVLESVLIESLEPRLNRQGGQQMGPELIQQEDPAFILEREQRLLQDALQRYGRR